MATHHNMYYLDGEVAFETLVFDTEHSNGITVLRAPDKRDGWMGAILFVIELKDIGLEVGATREAILERAVPIYRAVVAAHNNTYERAWNAGRNNLRTQLQQLWKAD